MSSNCNKKRIEGRKRLGIGVNNRGGERSELTDLQVQDGQPPFTFLRRSEKIADWDEYLRDLKAVEWVCPVDMFPNAPFAEKWKDFAKVGAKIEVPHPQFTGELQVNSVATIIAFAGYKALLHFEHAGSGAHLFAWITYCSSIPKPLGYSLDNDILLLPVESAATEGKFDDYKRRNKSLIELTSGSKEDLYSIAKDHEKTVKQEFEALQRPFNLMDIIEVMDKEEPVRNRLAYVFSIVGDRIQIRYLDADPQDEGFCFSMKSELVHPIGWSHCVGQILKDHTRGDLCLPKLPIWRFPKCPTNLKISAQMVFEMRHPFYPFKIVAGSVKKRLKHGYFIAEVVTNSPLDSAEFVFHISSDYVLPCGFSQRYKIPLVVPRGECEESFSWQSYCYEKQVVRLELSDIPKKPFHKFVKGCKLEAVDVCQPLYLGPATVLNVAEHLLYIHFDGWPRTKVDCYQWISAFSSDIYPAGWAEMVGHSIQSHAKRPVPQDTYFIVGSSESMEGEVVNDSIVELFPTFTF